MCPVRAGADRGCLVLASGRWHIRPVAGSFFDGCIFNTVKKLLTPLMLQNTASLLRIVLSILPQWSCIHVPMLGACLIGINFVVESGFSDAH